MGRCHLSWRSLACFGADTKPHLRGLSLRYLYYHCDYLYLYFSLSLALDLVGLVFEFGKFGKDLFHGCCLSLYLMFLKLHKSSGWFILH